MRNYVVRRLFLVIPVMWLVVTIVFVLIHVIPGDVALLILDEDASEEAIESLQRQLGIDRPLHVQYMDWLWGVARLDLGNSFRKGRPGQTHSVVDELFKRLPVTVELGLFSLVISVVLAIPIGVYSAVKQDKAFDYLARGGAIVALSVPEFWIATMTIILAAVWFQWSPPIGFTNFSDNPVTNLQQLFLPATILAISSIGTKTRLTRATMLEV